MTCETLKFKAVNGQAWWNGHCGTNDCAACIIGVIIGAWKGLYNLVENTVTRCNKTRRRSQMVSIFKHWVQWIYIRPLPWGSLIRIVNSRFWLTDSSCNLIFSNGSQFAPTWFVASKLIHALLTFGTMTHGYVDFVTHGSGFAISKISEFPEWRNPRLAKRRGRHWRTNKRIPIWPSLIAHIAPERHTLLWLLEAWHASVFYY